MNCPNCGAAMRLDIGKECLACDYCGSLHFPEPEADGVSVLDGKSELNCPICAIPLAEAMISGRPLLYCERCRGMLVTMALFVEIILILRARRTQPPEPQHGFDKRDLQRVVVCPQCGERMDTHPYGGPGRVAIDSCSNCHLNWLDHSELHQIVAAPVWHNEDV
ncbi:MAG: zf-TFIIB domain-containing protein [Bryobacteraceae bacterium]